MMPPTHWSSLRFLCPRLIRHSGSTCLAFLRRRRSGPSGCGHHSAGLFQLTSHGRARGWTRPRRFGPGVLDGARELRRICLHMVAETPAGPARGRARGLIMSLVRAYRRRRYTCLFVSLLVTLGAGSTLDMLFPRYNPLELLLALNLLASIASVAYEGRTRLPFVLGAGFLVARGILAALGVPGMLAFSE